MLSSLPLYLCLGALTGLLAGLFGIGGGSIIVPALIAVFVWQGFSADVLTHMALGTSLAAIAVSAVSSARTHHSHQAVNWAVIKQLLPGVLLGIVLGAQLAGSLNGSLLQTGFGVFLVLISLQMWFGWQPQSNIAENLPSRVGMTTAGTFIGGLSALFGIGGGSLTVPFLSWYGTRMQQAVGTAAALGLPLACAGALAFIWQGWGKTGLPEYSSGYVYWPAFVGIASASFVSAHIGAKWAHRLPAAKLKKIFAVFMLIIGIYFLLKATV